MSNKRLYHTKYQSRCLYELTSFINNEQMVAEDVDLAVRPKKFGWAEILASTTLSARLDALRIDQGYPGEILP